MEEKKQEPQPDKPEVEESKMDGIQAASASDDQPAKKKLKGPKPRGLTKFKPVAAEEVEVEEGEMSLNQKRKRDQRIAKKEAEDKARREEEER